MAMRSEDILTNNPSTTGPAESLESETPGAPGKAEAAKEQTAAVAQSAVDAGKDVVHEAAAQVSVVASDAKDQFGAVVGQVKDEVKSQIDARGQQAADGLRTLSTQLSSLAQGRPQEAGRVGELVTEAQHRVQAYADTLQQRGPQAIVEDLAAFARRRPVLFLLAATAGGFAVGRLVRGGAAANSQAGNSTGSSAPLARPEDRLAIDQSSSAAYAAPSQNAPR